MQNEYKYSIGLMSGTSLDGLDLVYVKFHHLNYTDFKILHATTKSYSEYWQHALSNAIHWSQDDINQLHIDYGVFLGKQVNAFVEEFNITKIDFIASHGHTIFHEPDKGITLQIGDGQAIANITNHKVICDFRTQDVEFGGQGAPLVPVGDQLLFGQYNSCINLGGFANISYQENNKRIAFDICPVNIVLNHYTRKIGYDFDESGTIAKTGNINHELLTALNSLSFYNKQPPKSLGLEWVTTQVFPLINNLETAIPIILRTFVKHSAIQIGKTLKGKEPVLVTGGGVYNSFLMEEVENEAGFKITKQSDMLVEFKEALIFAFLGLLRNNGEINCLHSVTGASKDHSSGKMYTPKKDSKES